MNAKTNKAAAKKAVDEGKKGDETAENLTALTKMLKKNMLALDNVRRPEINNPIITNDDLEMLNLFMYNAYVIVEEYAANLRAKDRTRLNSVGNKKMGFLENAYDYAMESPLFLPQYLTVERFTRDYDYFKAVRALLQLTDQIRELFWNMTIEAADVAYTDALEFYKTVQEAAKRRVDGADTIYRALETFFKKTMPEDAEETKKEQERDVKAFFSGKREGEILIRNVKPKVIAGVHEVIEKKIENSVSIHEKKDAEIDE